MMKNLSLLLLSVVIFQAVKSEIRDQRHFQMKLGTVNEYLGKSVEQANALGTSDLKEAQNAVDDYCKDVKESFKFLNKAIADNTRNTEHGKTLHATLEEAKKLQKWNDDNLHLHSDSTKLKTNLKLSLAKYEEIVKSIAEAFPNIKDSTEKTERAVNYLMDFLDNSLFLIKKLDYHLEFKKYTNVELRKNFFKVLGEDLASLEQITPGSYRLNELVIHGRQLTFLLKQLIDRLSKWHPNNALKPKLEATITELREILAGTERHSTPNSSLDNMKVMYPLWLRGIATNIENLDVAFEEQPDEVVRKCLYDVVGITMNYKTIFANLAGSKN